MMTVNYRKKNSTLKINFSSFPRKPFLTWEMLSANGRKDLQMHSSFPLVGGKGLLLRQWGKRGQCPSLGCALSKDGAPCLPPSK